MKHTAMISTREYITKNNSHLPKTLTTRKIQLTFKINKKKPCLNHKVFQNFEKQKRALHVRSILHEEDECFDNMPPTKRRSIPFATSRCTFSSII